MPNSKLPTLKEALGGGPSAAHSGLPTVRQALGHSDTKLPSLKDVLNAPPSPAPAKKSSGGFLHDLGHAVTGGAHWVGQKSELAATDLKNIPGGVVHAGIGVEKDELHALRHGDLAGAVNPVELALHGKNTRALIKGTVKGTVQTVAHPLRDPFQTLLLASGAAGGVGSVVGRLGEAGRVIDEGGTFGDVVKAASKKPPVKPRLLTVNGETTPLHASKNPAVKALQAIHDHVVQHAIDNKPDSRVGSYGTKRIGGAIDETARRQAAMRNAPASVLDRASLKLTGPAKKLTGTTRLHQAALELTSTNTPPEEAAAFHEAQAADGVNPNRNRVVAKLYRAVAKKGLVTTNEHGDVVVNATDHPDLAKADVALHTVQGKGDEILARYGVRTPEQLQARVDAPGRVRAGATYEKPTAAKAGVPSQTLLKARARVTRLQALHDRATAERPTSPGESPVVAPKTPPRAERIGGALSVAKDELQQLEQQAANRVKGTGIVGGDTARPGRGFVSYKLEEKKAPTSAAAASSSPVVGEAKSPITSQSFTGEGLAKGYVPKDITGPAARNFRQIMRFVNTSERRSQAIRAGTAAKRTSRDVLARIPGVEHDKIPATVNDLLGTSKLTTDDVNGLHAALDEFKQQLVPGLKDRFAADNQAGIGTPAPKGHVWVDRNLLGELAKPGRGPRGVIGRQVDNINSAVTAATVYFKIGHVGTRVLTNAATNIIQGSATPLQIAKSNTLWHAIDDTEKARALAATGEHGFTAMPHSGVSLVSRIAGRGASWWARHADAPFRFNSLAYEARKAGFDTPEKFRYLLDKLEDPTGLDAAQTAKIDWVGKRANRESIAYDRLSHGEKQYLSSALWFYPWLRGTASFLGNTILEHPYKAAVGGTLAKQSEQVQQQQLGDLPSYERGLVQLAGGAEPRVADLSTFSPFATPADLLDAAARPAGVIGFANPVYGGLATAITGVNQFGEKTTTPLTDAATQVFSPTPEAQILTAFLNRHKDQSRHMFPQSRQWAGTKTPLLRALLGPATPRRINLAAAASAAARERSGH